MAESHFNSDNNTSLLIQHNNDRYSK